MKLVSPPIVRSLLVIVCCASVPPGCAGTIEELPGSPVTTDGATGGGDGSPAGVDSYHPGDQGLPDDATRQDDATPPSDDSATQGCLTQAEYEASLVADFPDRDALPQSPAPKPWKCLSVCNNVTSSKCYDVCKAPVFNSELPTIYSKPSIPACVDPLQWKRDRVIAAAKKWIGTHYLPCSRIPACGGLDCSAFTSWVYNYGLGIKFIVGGVEDQLNDPLAGTTRINRSGSSIENFVKKLKKGDLLFFKDGGAWQHAAIYIGGYQFIHANPSPANGVQLETLAPSTYNWYEPRLAAAKRIIE